MNEKKRIQIHAQPTLERNLEMKRRDSQAAAADGFAIVSASGFAIVSASGFAIVSASGFAIV